MDIFRSSLPPSLVVSLMDVNRPDSRCQSLKPSLVFLNRASYGRRRNNDVTSHEREVTMMLHHNLRTDAQICGTSATQASLFVRHGRGVNRVYLHVRFEQNLRWAQVGLLQTTHSWVNGGVLLGVRIHRGVASEKIYLSG